LRANIAAGITADRFL